MAVNTLRTAKHSTHCLLHKCERLTLWRIRLVLGCCSVLLTRRRLLILQTRTRRPSLIISWWNSVKRQRQTLTVKAKFFSIPVVWDSFLRLFNNHSRRPLCAWPKLSLLQVQHVVLSLRESGFIAFDFQQNQICHMLLCLNYIFLTSSVVDSNLSTSDTLPSSPSVWLKPPQVRKNKGQQVLKNLKTKQHTHNNHDCAVRI
jgi:hypothetical protein